MIVKNNVPDILESESRLKTHRGYEKSFLALIFIFIVGILLELITPGKNINLPKYPFSVYLISGYTVLIVILYIYYRKTKVVDWLSSVPAAISAAFGIVACLIILNIIPQNDKSGYALLNSMGLAHLRSSFIIIFVYIYLLTVLEFTILKKIFPLTTANIAFYFGHTGFWLIIVALGIGSPDSKHVTINLLENGKESNIGISESEEMVKVPFSIKLSDFVLEEYPPQLFIKVNNVEKLVSGIFHKPTEIQKGAVYRYREWFIYITNYMPNAVYTDSTIVSSNLPESSPVAYIDVVNIKKKTKYQGWISPGNAYQKQQTFAPDSNFMVILKPSVIKRIHSDISITDSLYVQTYTINSDKPLNINGWYLYQSGYDISKGKWSTLSVFKAVKDPWIKFLLTGVIMLAIGTITILFNKKNKT